MAVTLDRVRTLDDVRYVCNNLRADDAAEVFALSNHDNPNLLAQEVIGYWGELMWVAKLHGEPVALFGALNMWPGVWSAWLIATDEFPAVGLSVTKFIHREVIPLLKEKGAHRCEARSMSTHTWSHEWLKSLGAVEEATLIGYGKGKEDFLVYRLKL